MPVKGINHDLEGCNWGYPHLQVHGRCARCSSITPMGPGNHLHQQKTGRLINCAGVGWRAQQSSNWKSEGVTSGLGSRVSACLRLPVVRSKCQENLLSRVAPMLSFTAGDEVTSHDKTHTGGFGGEEGRGAEAIL